MVDAAHIDPATGLPRPTRAFWSVQCLRGVAALMIVVGHAQTMVATHATAPFSRSTALPWGASVDLFFVISGFIMVHASHRLFAAPGGAGRFLARRIVRVAPLYWLATGAMLALLAIGSLKGGDAFPGPAAILASLAFVPFDTWGDGRLFPVLDLGWTLDYELFFYAVFAVFLTLPRRAALIGVAATMLALTFVGGLLPTGSAVWFWSRPIIIDFVLGTLVGAAVAEGYRFHGAVRLALGVAGAVLLAADPHAVFAAPLGVTVANDWPRVLWAGIPCAALLAAATLGGEGRRPSLARPLVALGDASYSLYLLHPFALIVVEKLIQKSVFVDGVRGEVLAVAAVGLAVLVAVCAFHGIERPMTARLTRLIDRRDRPAKAVAGPASRTA